MRSNLICPSTAVKVSGHHKGLHGLHGLHDLHGCHLGVGHGWGTVGCEALGHTWSPWVYMAATQHGFKLVQGHGGTKWLLNKLAIKWLLSSMYATVAFGGGLAKMAFAAAAAH